MTNTGFGALSLTPAPDVQDYGFGSPSNNLQGRDTGFGSPFDIADAAITISGESVALPDDGGVTLRLVYDWRNLNIVIPPRYAGPFKVTYIEQLTGDKTASYGLQSTDCYTEASQYALIAHVPPLTRGTYDLSIEWLSINKIIVTSAFTVYPRPRCASAYSIRQHIPQWLKKGPHIPENEDIGLYKRPGTLEMLTKVFGDSVETFCGVPMTATTAELVNGSSTLFVESTIGFPNKGSVFVGTVRISYTAKTMTSFTNITSDLYIPSTIPVGKEVTLDVTTA